MAAVLACPASAFAVDDEYTVYVGGNAMTASGTSESWCAQDGSGVSNTQPDSYGAHLYLDVDNGSALTLEINGLNVAGVDEDADSKGAGIYSEQPLVIRYSGENTVTAASIKDHARTSVDNAWYYVSYGIYSNGLTLIGADESAKLTVTAGDVCGSVYGIYSTDALTAQKGTLVCTAGNTVWIQNEWEFFSVGMYAKNSLTLEDGVDVTATSGCASTQSYTGGGSSGIMCVGNIDIKDCTVHAESEETHDPSLKDGYDENGVYYSYRHFSRGIYAWSGSTSDNGLGNITITNSTVVAKSGDTGGQSLTAVDGNVGILSYGGNITINSGDVTATSGTESLNSGDPTYGICARQTNGSSTKTAILTINGGTVTATADESPGDMCAGMYAYNGIAINGGTVTAIGIDGTACAGIWSDWNLTVANDAKVYATSKEASTYSYGVIVWNNFHMSGHTELHATAGNTTAQSSDTMTASARRSYGFYMGDSYPKETAGSQNTFTLTGGIFEAQSIADENSTSGIVDVKGVGGTEYALKFFDVVGNEPTFADAAQPNAHWYWWTLDSDRAKENENLSPIKEYVHDDDEANYTSKYLFIAPLFGDLSVSKTVVGDDADVNQEFSFTVTLGDSSISGKYGDMEFTDGVATFVLKDGEGKTAEGLPYGTAYEVTEADYSAVGYATTSENATGTLTKGTAVSFVNTRESAPTPETGDLSVMKTVTGDGADLSKEFSFTVTLDDASVSGTYGDLEFTDGVAEFALKHGETETAEGLPAGVGYTVVEDDYTSEGYTATSENASGTIAKDATAAVSFTNAYAAPVPDTGGLRVTKTVTGDGAEADRAFGFTVTLGDDSINGDYGEMTFTNGVAEFALKGGESTAATGLPAGVTYKVAEEDCSVDGYETTATGEAGTIESGKTVEVAFVNHKDGKEPDPGPTDPDPDDPDEPDDPDPDPDDPDDPDEPDPDPDDPDDPDNPDPDPVNPAPSDPEPTDDKPAGTTSDSAESSDDATDEESQKSLSTPKTGDGAAMPWTLLAFASALVAAAECAKRGTTDKEMDK